MRRLVMGPLEILGLQAEEDVQARDFERQTTGIQVVPS